MLVISVESGEEVLATVARQVREKGIVKGAIVSLIGAVGSARIGNMPKDNAAEDIVTEYRQPMEISGTGEITGGTPHIHCVLSAEGDSALTGHLHQATVDSWFVHVYVIAM